MHLHAQMHDGQLQIIHGQIQLGGGADRANDFALGNGHQIIVVQLHRNQ